MKTKFFIAGMLLASTTVVRAATNDLTSVLQKGLFEEEANHNLEAAAQAYQAVSAQFDKDRKLAATAIFRLGEVYRKQGKTNEATAQYERIVREFSDQQTLATLSRQNLAGLRTVSSPDAANDFSARVRSIIDRASRPVTTDSTTEDEEKEIRRIQAMIQNSPDLINAPGEGGLTPLGRAASAGWVRVATFLLDAGAAVDRPTPNSTPLLLAAAGGHRAMVELLVKRGANINAHYGGGGATPLHLAAEKGFLSLAEVLVQLKADLEARNSQANGEQTPLHRAAAQGHPAMVAFLISKGAEIEAADRSGNRPLALAALFGHTEVINTLLKAGAQVDAADATGATALAAAARRGQVEPVKALLAANADPRGGKGGPALFGAINNPTVMELLLTAGAGPNVTNDSGNTLLNATLWQGDERNVALLLKHGADVNARDNLRMTPLQMAVWRESVPMVSLLLSNRADVNAEGQAGRSALLMAKEAMSGFRPYKPGEYGGQGLPPNATVARRIAEILRAHGAVEEMPFFNRIEVRRPAAGYSSVAFQFGTNDWNEFSLLELLALHYGFLSLERNAVWEVNKSTVPSQFWGKAACQFPDFGRVVVRRPDRNGPRWTEIPVNVAALLDAGDCARDMKLQPGDIVEIPEADHPVNEKWSGLLEVQRSNLLHCVSRTITISIKGAPTKLPLKPEFNITRGVGAYGELTRALTKGSFMLKSVLAQSRLLRASSDVTRVKVTRRAGGKNQEWVLNCGTGNDPDLWLRDGDVIEVPDKP